MKPFRARGEVTLGSEKIAFERLTAEIDRKWVEGRFAYVWAAGDKPARLDADLNAAELDIDALLAFTDAARGSTTFETPREVTLGLGIGRAVVAGISASDISARFRRDATGLHVERLSIGNVGGNAFDVSGRIDATSSPPQGAIAMRLDARNLAGVVALAEKFAPEAADWVRRLSQRMPQAQLNATLALEQDGAGKLTLDGRAGDMRVTLRGETARAAAAASDLQNLPTTDVKLEAQGGVGQRQCRCRSAQSRRHHRGRRRQAGPAQPHRQWSAQQSPARWPPARRRPRRRGQRHGAASASTRRRPICGSR